MFARPLLSVALPIALAAIAGCANADAGKADAGPQLIVKFRDAGAGCDQRVVAGLSARAGFNFRWVRPMSGDACVIRVGRSVDAAAALTALRALPELEYAEMDAPVRAN